MVYFSALSASTGTSKPKTVFFLVLSLHCQLSAPELADPFAYLDLDQCRWTWSDVLISRLFKLLMYLIIIMGCQTWELLGQRAIFASSEFIWNSKQKLYSCLPLLVGKDYVLFEVFPGSFSMKFGTLVWSIY